MDANKRKAGLARAEKLSPQCRSEIARVAAARRWAGHEPAPAEPFVQLPLRLTVAQRNALQAYVERRGLSSLTEGVRDLIHRTTKTPAPPAVAVGPVPVEYGKRLKPGR